MAVVTNTFRTSDAGANKETFSDVVSRIDPEDTPIYSDTGKETFEGTHPEWATESIDAAAENIHEEGAEYTFAAITPATKLGAYTQILRKEGILSKSQDANKNAGNVETIKHAKLLKGKALRLDVELAIVTNNASVGGTTREIGGLPSWITSNVDRGSNGSNGGYSSGTGLTVAATNGTQRAFTKTIMDAVMQDGYESGANFRKLYVSPYVKSVFVTFMSDSNVAAFRSSADGSSGNVIDGDADMYRGPHGKITVVPNRVMGASAGVARNAFFVDPEYLKFGWFRPIKEDKDAATTSTGDNRKFVIIGEGAVKVTNEKGLGVAADLYGLTASS